MAIPDLLRSCPLFFELYDNEVERIVRFCHVLSLQPGEKVFREGETGNQVYVVLGGRAQVQKVGTDGTSHIAIAQLGPGDVFGEMILVDESRRSAEVEALSELDVLELKYVDIFSIFQSEPRIFGLILLNLSRLLARRIKATNQHILDLKKPPKKAAA